MCGFGGGNAADKAAKEAREREEERASRIRAGMERIDDTFSQFDDDFFDGRQQAYLDFAMPQLDEKYADARQQAIFALSRSGNLGSSAGADLLGDLQRDYNRFQLDIASRAADQANQARRDVESNRSQLVAELNSSANDTAAAQAAADRAMMLSAQPAFSPLEIVFQNVTAGLANRVDDGTGRGLGTRLFGGSTGASGGSGRVVNG